MQIRHKSRARGTFSTYSSSSAAERRQESGIPFDPNDTVEESNTEGACSPESADEYSRQPAPPQSLPKSTRKGTLPDCYEFLRLKFQANE